MSKLLDIATQLLNIEKQEAIDKEVLGHMERAREILRGLNVIGAEDGS